MMTFYEIFDEATRYFDKMNEIYLILIKLNTGLYSQYKAYVDRLQRMNQKRMVSKWSPLLVKGRAKERENIKKE